MAPICEKKTNFKVPRKRNAITTTAYNIDKSFSADVLQIFLRDQCSRYALNNRSAVLKITTSVDIINL